MAPYAHSILATFAYNLQQMQYVVKYDGWLTQYEEPIYQVLAVVVAGKQKAAEILPMSIGNELSR
jgi:hypothetical protein